MNFDYLRIERSLRIGLALAGVAYWINLFLLMTEYDKGHTAIFVSLLLSSLFAGCVTAYILTQRLYRQGAHWVALCFFLPPLMPLVAMLPPGEMYIRPTNRTSPLRSEQYFDPSPRANTSRSSDENGQVRCVRCGTIYGVTLILFDPNEVKVASCRVCPVDNVYAICARCANLENVQGGPCPSCSAQHMWQVRGMVPKKVLQVDK